MNQVPRWRRRLFLEIFANINRIAKTGVTILVVEQNVRMALILAQYGYIIRDGVIMMEGEAKKLISDPAVKESFLVGRRQIQQRRSGTEPQ